MEVPGKQVSPEKTAEESGNNKTGKERRSSTSRQSTDDKVQDVDGGSQLILETDIKKEVVTDEDGSDFETDDDATDELDDRLVIDETSKEKKTTTNDSQKQKVTGPQGTSKLRGSTHKSPTEDRRNKTVDSEGQNVTAKKKTETSRKSSLDDPKPGTSKTPRKPLKVKIVRRSKPFLAKVVQASDENDSSGASTSKEPIRIVLKTEGNAWHTPFDIGWRREVVFRGTSDPSPRKKPPADVYYFAPCNTKLRSMPEILNYLREKNVNLSLANFSFMKEPIFHPPQEVVRQAHARGSFGFKTSPGVTKTPPLKTPAVKTPKPKVSRIK